MILFVFERNKSSQISAVEVAPNNHTLNVKIFDFNRIEGTCLDNWTVIPMSHGWELLTARCGSLECEKSVQELAFRVMRISAAIFRAADGAMPV